MSFEHTNLTPELAAYVRGVSLRESPIQRALREETAALPMARMQITPEQGQFMALLIQLTGARKVLEVGVFTGYSSLSMALALPVDGSIVACDVSEEWTSMGQRYWKQAGVSGKISLRLAPGMDTLTGLLEAGEEETFDFAFIDADKENYDGYYELALRLLRKGGVAAIDNVLWHGRVIDTTAADEETEAIRRLNEKLHRDERIDLTLVPIGDGLTLARKR